jgi:hypothetical protein
MLCLTLSVRSCREWSKRSAPTLIEIERKCDLAGRPRELLDFALVVTLNSKFRWLRLCLCPSLQPYLQRSGKIACRSS